MKTQPPSLSFQHNFFHEIQTQAVNKHARLVEIGQPQMETNEALPTRETNPADLADEDIIRKWPRLKEWIRAFGVVFMSCKVSFYVDGLRTL